MKSIFVALAACAACCVAGTAQASSVIDFEALPIGYIPAGSNLGPFELSSDYEIYVRDPDAELPGTGSRYGILTGVTSFKGIADFLSFDVNIARPGVPDFTATLQINLFRNGSFLSGLTFVTDADPNSVETVVLPTLGQQADELRIAYSCVLACGPAIDNITYDNFKAAIPEPSTWALMILGFGSAGALLRRRDARVGA